MLLELCKSAVHIMFSDMCPLEREREREQGRKWGGTERGRVGLGLREKGGCGWAGAWGWGRRRQGGGRQQSRCSPGALHCGGKGRTGLVLPSSPCSLSSSRFLHPLPCSHSAWHCWYLPSTSPSMKWDWPKGLTTHGSKSPDIAWSFERSTSQLPAPMERWPVVAQGILITYFVFYGLRVQAEGVAPPTIYTTIKTC